jgi:hypothetical protein
MEGILYSPDGVQGDLNYRLYGTSWWPLVMKRTQVYAWKASSTLQMACQVNFLDWFIKDDLIVTYGDTEDTAKWILYSLDEMPVDLIDQLKLTSRWAQVMRRTKQLNGGHFYSPNRMPGKFSWLIYWSWPRGGLMSWGGQHCMRNVRVAREACS